ncbi:MAG: SGNH/GDSL hydrolase family protein [Pseudomonadota bacterium]
MKQFVLAVALAAALPLGAQAKSVSQLIVFGDSNVDIGRLSGELVSNPADGAVVPPSTVAGRSSDGPLITEYLAQTLRVPQLNFAWGGATSGATNIVGAFFPSATDVGPTGQLSQIAEFNALLGGAPADPDALYILWAGSNDLFFPDKNDQGAIDAAVGEATANIAAAAEALSDLGAGHIVIANRTTRPFFSDADRPADEPDADKKNDAAGRQLNAALADLVPLLDGTLDADVALFDNYAIIRDLIAGSGSNGFLAYDPTPAQYCDGAPPGTDCSVLINWDGAHKTSAVHAAMAGEFVSQFGLAPVPLPAGVWLLLGGLGALGAVRLRAQG